MRLLMIGHLFGDFYLQNNKLAEGKKAAERNTFLRALGVHSVIYLLTMYVVMAVTTGSFVRGILPVLIAGITHGAVDFLKLRIEKRDSRLEKYEWISFTADQMVHIGILYALDCIFNIHADFTWFPIQLEYFIMQYPGILTVLIAILICGKPAAIIVSLVFKMVPRTIEEAAKPAKTKESDIEDAKKDSEIKDMKEEQKSEEELQIGSWIGILEREIMLFLALMGQYGAIGFVLAAKSLARFKQLENKAFAEKYLLGTLLSSAIALLCIGMCMVL